MDMGYKYAIVSTNTGGLMEELKAIIQGRDKQGKLVLITQNEIYLLVQAPSNTYLPKGEEVTLIREAGKRRMSDWRIKV